MYVIENDRGNLHSGSGAGERATGMVKALMERAPTTSKARAALENMMIWSVVGRTDDNGTRPDVLGLGERNLGELRSG